MAPSPTAASPTQTAATLPVPMATSPSPTATSPVPSFGGSVGGAPYPNSAPSGNTVPSATTAPYRTAPPGTTRTPAEIALGVQSPISPAVPAPPAEAEIATTAPIGSRIAAHLIDVALTTAIATVASAAAYLIVWVTLFTTSPIVPATAIGLIVGLSAAINLYGVVYLTGRTGQSWGRRMMGIAVVDSRTGLPIGPLKVWLREVLRAVTVVSDLSVFFDSRGAQRGWADLACGSRVVIATRPATVGVQS